MLPRRSSSVSTMRTAWECRAITAGTIHYEGFALRITYWRPA